MVKYLIFLICWLISALPAAGAPVVFNNALRARVLEKTGVSNKDISLYKNIFRDIEEENISAAQQKISKLKNHILTGHVLAGIYLSKSYTSSVPELTQWLKKYSDLPQARAIYNLAVQKGGREAVRNPWGEKYPLLYSPYSWYNNQYEQLSDENRKYVRQQVSDFRRYLNKGKTKAARGILENKKFRMTIPDKEYDAMSVTLATSYLLDNQNTLAWQWVQKAARRSKDSMAYWIGGLAAWRLKNYKNAADFFVHLGEKKQSDEWLVSAGRYWAYRAYSRLNNKTAAQKQLKAAAVYKRTFYGMLAAYQLGDDWQDNWRSAALINDYAQENYIHELLSSPAVCRALLLLQAKNKKMAEKEIRAVYKELNKSQKEALLFIARQQEMHALVILLANDIKDNEGGLFYDEAAYPVPNWKPHGGWHIDNAFAWAVVRQESAFFPKATSGAGAKGLMQLMPATAFHITKNPKIKHDSSVLFDEAYNLSLGQKYIAYLAEKPYINGNLFYIIAAYNAGPGNLYKWQKKVQYNDDPLLFIEVIPARETRIYIERVMANYWMYEARFGKKHPSAAALAAGKWPQLP